MASRHELTLREKIAVIQERESSGISHRRLAKMFSTGKTQIQTILKRKHQYQDAYEHSGSNAGERKRPCSYASENDEINTLTWQWYSRMRTSATTITGPMIQAQALHYAKELGKDQFKASNGWLDSFKRRNSIGQQTVRGETSSVSQTTEESWTARVPTLVAGYAKRNIYSMSETGLFYRALPDKTFSLHGEDCKGGKHPSERLTVLLCVNMEGEFVPPLVVGKSSHSQCFGEISDENALPVKWVCNKKAWMTVEIFADWLKDFNSRMRSENRHVLLFLDSAPSHPQHITMSNTKMVFIPPSTACLHPLAQGVIHTFKVMYRKRLILNALSLLDKGDAPDATAVQEDITVLDACCWMRGACYDIKPDTVTNCFIKSGFPGDVAAAGDSTTQADPQAELSELLSLTVGTLLLPEPLDAQAYCTIDEHIPSSEELDQGWEDALLKDLKAKRAKENGSLLHVRNEEDVTEQAELVAEQFVEEVVEEEVAEEKEGEEEVPAPWCEIHSHIDALYWARQLWLYTMEYGDEDLADHFTPIMDSVQREAIASIVQQTTPQSTFTKKD